ncbi:ABC transporter ATP-binding protein/permease [Patescibacteria group bacterium]|nr:ABC transporter ATP-binding protein/permease [Patescibacteria group bacterium]
MKKTLNTNEEHHQLRNPYAFFWHSVKSSYIYLFAAVVLVIFAAGISQGSNYLFKLIIDAVEQGDATAAMWWGLSFPVVIFFVQLLYRGSGFMGAILTNNATKRARDTVTEHVLSHGHTYYSGRFAGAVGNKIRNVTGAVDSTIPDLLWNLLDTLVTYIVTVALIATVDPLAALIFVILIVCLVLLNIPFSKHKSKLSTVSADISSRFQARLIDTITNISAVRQYTKAVNERNGLFDLSELQMNAQKRSWFFTEWTFLVNNIVLFAFATLMIWLLVVRWQEGAVSPGEVVLALALYAQLTGSLMFIGQMLNRVARSYGEMQEGLDDIYVPYDITDRPNAKNLVSNGGEVSWQHVSFSFQSHQVFNDFSLTIPAGQRVGLVGSSGAGKSTFVSLLLRQHDIPKGSISIDGQDIATVTQDSLRETISLVPQEPLLFHRTIRENILYGMPHATQAEVEAVARKAYAHEFIEKLEQKYDTLVGERGIKLSGGQKQRVAIARAMLKDAPILVLDEATSALDSESEVAIQKALHVLMAGKTVIAIAHRLSTLREMDRIIVLEEGKIVEDGSHDALVAYGGVYARLWEHQSGGFV